MRQILLALPLLMAGLVGCPTADELQNQLKATGEPVITSMVPSNAKIGDTVTLRGLNFEATAGKVGYQDANGGITVANVSGWADDFVVTKVPSLTGNPAKAKVHLQTASGKAVAINPSLNITY